MMRAPLLAALLLACASVLHAQTAEAGDTVRADSVPAEAAPARPSRWAAPFAVQSTGRPTPHRVQGEVVWAGASERRARPTDVEVTETPDTVGRDSAPVRRDSTARAPRTAARDTASAPRRRTTRPDSTARRDTVASTRTPARRDTTATSRTAARRDTTTASRATARRDSAASRPPVRRDTAAAPRPRPRTHTVAAGETLSAIARRYGVTTAQLRALNPEATADGLERGAVLRLPPAPRPVGATAARPAAPSTPTQRPATPPARRRTHTVAAGETLYGLSRRYGVTTDALRRANDLGESDGLRTGQTLVIPAP